MMTNKINHVFVLMLENHSFDHLLGFSGIANKTTSINGLKGNESNTYDSKSYPVKEGAVDPMPTDPGHEFLDTLEQLCGVGVKNPFPKGPYPPINNSGFVSNYATTRTEGHPPSPEEIGDVMYCCNSSEQVPTLYQLAKEFAVCDHWFSSMPGPTWPNRFFALGASSAGLDDSPSTEHIAEWESFWGFTYPHGSIFDLLNKSGLKWRLYNDFWNKFGTSEGYLGGEIPMVAAIKGIHHWDVNHFSDFDDDLNEDYSAHFTFIEPNYGDIISNTYKGGSSQHPMDSLAAGERLIAATYNAIRHSPIWETSLLIITYDEHGGFYDHVAPPPAVPPNDGSNSKLNKHDFDFTQYGLRVPAVIVSPLIPKNSIDHTLYDHTSIIKTVQELHNLEPLTDRDRHANSLMDLLSLDEARTDCPTSVEAVPVPPSGAQLSSEMKNKIDEEPLPDSGNLIGILLAAGQIDYQLSGGQAEDIKAKVQGIKTKGEARAYINQVLEKWKQ